MVMPLEPERKEYLESHFPLLAHRRYAVRAPPDKSYNCIAWAVGSTSECWWPDPYALWPIRERRVSVSCFTQLLVSQGFERAADGAIEKGYSKVAMYLSNGIPTHIARIESETQWSSKLGRDELIEHEPDALNGADYGAPSLYFRKKN